MEVMNGLSRILHDDNGLQPPIVPSEPWLLHNRPTVTPPPSDLHLTADLTPL